MIADTSIRAYHETTDTRAVERDRLRALYMVEGPMTDRAAGRILNMEPSSVSGRRNELENIIVFGKATDPITGKTGRVHGLATLV